MRFTYYQQLDAKDCGPTCLKMIAKYYGKDFSIQTLRTASEIGKDGVNLLGIAQAAEAIGFKTIGVMVPLNKLLSQAPLPCIVHWGQNHFVVLITKKKKFRLKWDKGQVDELLIADPASGLISYSYEEFESKWATTIGKNNQKVGIALLLETSEKFTSDKTAIKSDSKKSKQLDLFYKELWEHKKLLVQVLLGILVGSLLQLILPFLVKSVVDIGIQTQNLHFIYIVLIAQLALIVARTSVEFIRTWILLHVSTRINLSILTEFLVKLLKLPIGYYDSKTIGDLLQRIGDNRRIEQFVTGTSINVIFSIFSLLIYSLVIAYFNISLYGIFLLGSIMYVIWIVMFLKRRRELNNKQFALGTENQNNIYQLITSVPELKINNAEIKKRWEWESLQVKNFKLSMSGLKLQQYQQAGALLINEGKNIIITFAAATSVINGQISLGGMVALQAIIGQLNSPVEQLIQFIQQWQDAKISLERLNEIHEMVEEDEIPFNKGSQNSDSIIIKDVSFTYVGAGNEKVLNNLNFKIPKGKITAIVGSSGSGKTTFLKLLLNFYQPQSGEIIYPPLDRTKFPPINLRELRSECGTVLQDGFIFSDTIANNISIVDNYPDNNKLQHALKVANLEDFISNLPMGINTKIGIEGNGISQGQRQRILIARAVYKDPEYIFFDEATNSLDAENEAIIMNNLNQFFHKKTVVVVAHRLSTVRNAHQIVVLEKGKIVEIGTHESLIKQKGRYYQLVVNQLELSA